MSDIFIHPDEFAHMIAPGGPADNMRKLENLLFWGVEELSELQLNEEE